MKSTAKPQSATSLPRAPRDDSRARFLKYMVMMAIRVACFLAMALVTPYSWYTFVFAAGAIFLPYIAVVLANVGEDAVAAVPENPERTLTGGAAPEAAAAAAPEPTVIRITEARRIDRGEP